MATFPAINYQPEMEGFKVLQRVPAPKATQVEEGPPITSQYNYTNWTKLAYVLVLTDAEFALFDDFYVNTLHRGRDRFQMRVGRFATALPWPLKTVYIEPGTLEGPEQAGIGHVRISFTLAVSGW